LTDQENFERGGDVASTAGQTASTEQSVADQAQDKAQEVAGQAQEVAGQPRAQLRDQIELLLSPAGTCSSTPCSLRCH
jgi:hypothetical protein